MILPNITHYEIETLAGLEEFTTNELTSKFGEQARVIAKSGNGHIVVDYSGDLRLFNGMRSVTAIHIVETFDIPRPRALLGNQNLGRVMEMVENVLKRNRDKDMKTLRVSGAGANSAVFARLKQEISRMTGLAVTEEPANLQITVRPDQNEKNGWQVMVRTSSMPLSSREWRVCSLPGALNASIAHVMASLADPARNERFLNLCCGSGTLMIERLEIGPAAQVVGIDSDKEALSCAEANLRVSGHSSKVELIWGDIGNVRLPDGSINTIVADLPYGMLVGEQSDIELTYHSAILEATRVAAPEANLLMITTRRKLFESTLEEFSHCWDNIRTIPVSVPHSRGYLNTAIHWLRRKA
jgi:23S rRNA G2445 N2-methylase RlmL